MNSNDNTSGDCPRNTSIMTSSEPQPIRTSTSSNHGCENNDSIMMMDEPPHHFNNHFRKDLNNGLSSYYPPNVLTRSTSTTTTTSRSSTSSTHQQQSQESFRMISRSYNERDLDGPHGGGGGRGGGSPSTNCWNSLSQSSLEEYGGGGNGGEGGGNGGGLINSSRLSSKSLEDYDKEMMESFGKVYKVVLTGGPCGGKTTGQARLCTFFENLGWKVFRVPETATILLGGGIKFSDLTMEQAMHFQEELLRTMMTIESVFFSLAETTKQNVLVICDRGTMDASSFIPREKWERILARNRLNEVEIRDTRYNQIIHMVSAAIGAEPFYTTEDHACRSEGLELAQELDRKAASAWVGHPYFDVVDNSTDFETKVCRMIQSVCQRLGIDVRDRLQTNSRKVKYLVKGPLPPDHVFPPGFQDFEVIFDYLQTNTDKMQARLRKRGQKGNWNYTYTVRRPELQGQVVEVKTTLTQRDYWNMLPQKDYSHLTVYKTRRCFLVNDQYFQMDIYNEPCHRRCKGLILLETYSTLSGSDLEARLPNFFTIVQEVTGDPRYSMFNLSLKEEWANNKNYCQTWTAPEPPTSK